MLSVLRHILNTAEEPMTTREEAIAAFIKTLAVALVTQHNALGKGTTDDHANLTRDDRAAV